MEPRHKRVKEMGSLHRKAVGLAEVPERKERLVLRIFIVSFSLATLVLLFLGIVIFVQVHGMSS